MKINILCVGKVKEREFSLAAAEYAKRISRFCPVEILEAPEFNVQDGRKKEGQEILRRIRGRAVTLEIEGREMSSPEFSSFLKKSFEASQELTFIIGGSTGLDPEVTARSDFALSFSKMTFPHTLMRVILLEQIYRAFAIAEGHPYHK